MRLKGVFRFDSDKAVLRLVRLIWRRGKGAGAGTPKDYDAMVSWALCWPSLRWRRETHGWMVRLLVVRIHYERSYAVRMV